jgi:hypothetical protein
VLDGVECFIVCGAALSPQTFDAIQTRVAAGATCIIASRLYNQYASGALPGDWLVVDDFAAPAIAAKLTPFLGPADVARFRFRDYTVDFCPAGDNDTLTVSLTPHINAASPAWINMKETR